MIRLRFDPACLAAPAPGTGRPSENRHEMHEVVVAGAVRTPIGKFGGALSRLSAAAARIGRGQRGALSRAGIAPSQVDEAIFGCARQAGGGPNVARQIAYRAGVPQEVPAYTVNMACGSGLKSLHLAYKSVLDGDARVVLAGGTESMSRVPYLLTDARWGYRMGHQEAVDAMYQDGFLCPLAEQLMGETAETLADMYEITREEQDAFALRSQAARQPRPSPRAGSTTRSCPWSPRPARARRRVARDEHPRAGHHPGLAGQAAAGLQGRRRARSRAGNSSGITDGAAAHARDAPRDAPTRSSVKPLARLLGVAAAGVDPKIMGIGVGAGGEAAARGR